MRRSGGASPVATWDADHQRVAYLGLNALPFGAVGSVSAFLRISIALWYIGVVGLNLCWSAFFDDFTLISRECHCNSAALSAEALFTLLGIKYATEGSKSVAFSTTVKSLGVVLTLDGKSTYRVLSKLASSNRISLRLTEHDVISLTFLKDRD